MKHASYKKAVEWIALNDEPTWIEDDEETVIQIAVMISVALIADVFEVSHLKVARDVLKYRIKNKSHIIY